MASMISEHESFQDVNGKPIVNGYIYVGVAGQDPKLNPVVIYSDRGLTVPIANPQRTDSYGRATNKIWVSERYSLKVEDANGVQKLQDLERGELDSSQATNLINVQGINDVTAEAVPPAASYIDKAVYVLTVVSTNTGAVTLDFGPGPKDVTKNNGDDLVAGDWPAGSIQRITYNEFSGRFDTITFSTVEINNEITQIKSDLKKIIPIGFPFPVWRHLGAPEPSNAGTEKYILLTAGQSGSGGYNEGLLTSETVSGTAPLVLATAVISHAESPLNGQTVPLINTSRQFIRPGSSGSAQEGQIESHSHTATLWRSNGSSDLSDRFGAYTDGNTRGTGTTNSTGGDETRPRNIGATYYMRIS